MSETTTTKDHYVRFVSRVKRDNRKFEKASAAQKRVIIAKDALLHVRAGILAPTGGTFGSARLKGGYWSKGRFIAPKPVDLRDLFVEKDFACLACARGGIVFATLMRRDKKKGLGFDGQQFVAEFPPTMMLNMEMVFEGCTMGRGLEQPVVEALKEWNDVTSYAGEEYFFSDDEYRFRRIMQWLIKHNGSFRLRSFLEKEIPLAKKLRRPRIKDKKNEDLL